MKQPSYYDSFQVLLLQIADEGRGEVLLGSSLDRARKAAEPFLVGEAFPDVYFEYPLAGAPFLDVTLLYGEMEPGTCVHAPAAGEVEAVFDWFRQARTDHPDVSFGFELDTKEPVLPAAAIHFQPRAHMQLVRPFCEVVGEPERADAYMRQAQRMPQGWPLSYFGMFRGRPGSPLRVCGYLDASAQVACAKDAARLTEAFERIGFSAYDDLLLQQASAFMAMAPGTVDFQFDVYPDGRLGDVFALDVQFEIEQPEAVREKFETGPAGRIMCALQGKGAADERWRHVPEMAFSRAIPVELEDGSVRKFAFTLMPQWAKIRWRAGVLQPAKMYCLGKAGTVDPDDRARKPAEAGLESKMM